VSEYQEFPPPERLPFHMAAKEMGRCIGNAVETAMDYPELRYAEGIARSKTLGVWYRHAWNVAADGTVVDTTWADIPGMRYIGRVFPIEQVIEQVREKEAYWFMERESYPDVPEGGSGIDCWTATQKEWLAA
jgi:hypothetical protein